MDRRRYTSFPDEDESSLLFNDNAVSSTTPTTNAAHKRNNSQPQNAEEEQAQQTREDALQAELATLQKINTTLEGVVASLRTAQSQVGTVAETVDGASSLLETWARILSQAEHNQRLILDPRWQGASHDALEVEQEAARRVMEVQRREVEERARREAAARKAEEEERRRAAGTVSAGQRGRGRILSSGYGRKAAPAASASRGGAATGKPGVNARPSSGIGRSGSSSTTRGRGLRGRGT